MSSKLRQRYYCKGKDEGEDLAKSYHSDLQVIGYGNLKKMYLNVPVWLTDRIQRCFTRYREHVGKEIRVEEGNTIKFSKFF